VGVAHATPGGREAFVGNARLIRPTPAAT